METGSACDHGRFKMSAVGCGYVAECDDLKKILAVIQFLEVSRVKVMQKGFHEVTFILGAES